MPLTTLRNTRATALCGALLLGALLPSLALANGEVEARNKQAVSEAFDRWAAGGNTFFRDILSGVVKNQREIDVKIDKTLATDWPLKRIEAVLRAILRAGGYELMFRKDVPARVVITEYVDVTHGLYGEDEPGLVNAVLDKLAREVRPGELEKKSAGQGKR